MPSVALRTASTSRMSPRISVTRGSFSASSTLANVPRTRLSSITIACGGEILQQKVDRRRTDKAAPPRDQDARTIDVHGSSSISLVSLSWLCTAGATSKGLRFYLAAFHAIPKTCRMLRMMKTGVPSRPSPSPLLEPLRAQAVPFADAGPRITLLAYPIDGSPRSLDGVVGLCTIWITIRVPSSEYRLNKDVRRASNHK